ncbi:hypothetical protein [Negadavirga shengliensis]|uniref:DUF4287 domain-containing protein n=1 Tax=Negadavirga shengliensis TaxID=1389218 RepID=A0ABV9T797_9BACT
MSIVSEESIKKATGKTWSYWFDYLDRINAGQFSHKEIADKLHELDGVTGWWAQTITVEYERKIGRREVGQTCEGDFQASASKTLPGTMDHVFFLWQEFVRDMDRFNHVAYDSVPQLSETQKWRYWRVNLKDGSRVSIIINQKSEGKVLLAVNQEKLTDAKAVEDWKAYWKTQLQEFHRWI